MRIKGKYVAQVEIDIDFPYRKEMLPFEEIKEKTVGGWVTDGIKSAIENEVMDIGLAKVTVAQTYADLYEVKDEDEQEG